MRLFLLAAVALLVPVETAWAQARVLPREAESGFAMFMQRVQQGALGPGVVNANISLEKNEARVELVLKSGAHHQLRVRPGDGAEGSPSSRFTVVPENGASTEDVRPVGALLDRCFPADPFIVAMGETPITSDDESAFARVLRPMTPRHLVLVLVIQLVTVLLCVLALLRKRPPGAGLSTDTR